MRRGVEPHIELAPILMTGLLTTPLPEFHECFDLEACVNFYKETLLLEDFAMINYTAVSKVRI